jgi:hypothetical protein
VGRLRAPINFSVADPNALSKASDSVVTQMGLLFESEQLEDTIRRATGDRARTLERIRDIAGAFQEAGVPVDLGALAPSL